MSQSPKALSIITLTVTIFFGLSGARPAEAGPNRFYFEDFSSTTFKDTAYTSALWDTVAGEITLPPFSMTFIDSIATPGLAYGVVLRGRYAFVADLSGGLQVYDVWITSNPQLAGSYVTPSAAWDLALSGDYAYLACGSAGLYIADISDPTNPVFAASYNTPGYAHQVRVDGNFAFVADGANGLQVVDISDPTAPTTAGNYNSPGGGFALAVEGNHAYLGDGTSGLRVVDISDPTAPVSAGTVALPGTTRDIVIAGNVAFVASDLGVRVVDIADPALPVQSGSFPLSDDARGIAVAGNYLYVAADAIGVIAVDITTPASPAALDTIDTPGLAWRLAVSGETALVADGIGGLRLLDVSKYTLLDPLLAGGTTPFRASDCDLSGNFLFAADLELGLRVVDIANPASPVLVASLPTSGGSVGALDVDGDYAYLLDAAVGLVVVDVSDPFNPAPAGSLGPFSSPTDIQVVGDYAFIANNWDGLLIVDVSVPTAPAPAGSLAIGGQAYSVAVDGDVACVGRWSGGIFTVDVSDPTNPVTLGSQNSFSNAVSMEFSGDNLYVIDRNWGLQIVDMSDPALPTVVGDLPLTGVYPSDIALAGKWAMVTAGHLVHRVRLNSPTSPITYGQFANTGGSAGYGVILEGDYAFFSDQDYGIRSLQVFDRQFDQGSALMTSTMMNVGADDLVQVRLASSQVDRLDWSLSTSLVGGSISLDPGEWRFTSKQDHYLQWRSYQYLEAANVRPLCSDLTIEWLFEFPVIDSILDIANDQGRNARLSFSRSGYDFPASALPIRDYSVFRKVDPSLSKQDAGHSKTEGLPPGAWDFIATVPADAEDQYSIVVPTLKDSTETAGQYRTTYLVRARTDTPGIYFNSYIDSGYSLDNLSPGVPFGFKVAYGQPGGNALSWDRSEAKDIQHFRVYRDTTADFTPTSATLVNATADTAWSDPIPKGRLYHYKISAVDFSGNESEAATPEEFSGFEDGGLPKRFSLRQNAPNPFNPTTTIRYAVPSGGGRIVLRIYDASGRLVRSLADRNESAGEKDVTWDGRNDRGEEVSSGIYLYRLEARAYSEQRKMLLLR